MFKELFPNNDKGKTPKIDNNANYTTTSHDYTINHILEMDNHVSIIIIKDKNPKGSTRRGKVFLQGIRLRHLIVKPLNPMSQLERVHLPYKVFHPKQKIHHLPRMSMTL